MQEVNVLYMVWITSSFVIDIFLLFDLGVCALQVLLIEYHFLAQKKEKERDWEGERGWGLILAFVCLKSALILVIFRYLRKLEKYWRPSVLQQSLEVIPWEHTLSQWLLRFLSCAFVNDLNQLEYCFS